MKKTAKKKSAEAPQRRHRLPKNRSEEIIAANLAGERDQTAYEKLGEPEEHGHLCAICIHLPTDYEPYGYRVRDGAPDCSCGCKWWLPLQVLPQDWGVCVNPRAPRCGLLTFEHQGCQFFEGDEEAEEDPVQTEAERRRVAKLIVAEAGRRRGAQRDSERG